MRKSFTLIEVLIATTVFVVIVLLFVVTIWSILKPKAKTESMNALQQAGQMIMDDMVADISRANIDNPAHTYVNFAITNSDGTVVACPPTCSGNRITLVQQPYANGSIVIRRAFELTDSAGNWQAGSNCTGGACRLGISEVVTNNGVDGPVIRTDALPYPNPNIDITYLNFQGYYWTSAGNDRQIAPYLTITMTLQSHYTGSSDSGTLTLRTTVRPPNLTTTVGPQIRELMVY